MSLYRDTEEMKMLIDKVRPYLNEHAELPDDAPEEIKKAGEEYNIHIYFTTNPSFFQEVFSIFFAFLQKNCVFIGFRSILLPIL